MKKRVAAVLALIASVSLACAPALTERQASVPAQRYTLTAEDDAFLEDLSRRTFMFFWEQADPTTGIIRDRSRTDGSPPSDASREIGSIAAVGFGLSGLCVAAERRWLPREQLVNRARTTLRFFAETMPHERGWFFHFVNLRSGAREWKSELSSIDTALLLAGVLTARRCFDTDADVVRHADAIYRRVDFQWMLGGRPTLLSHGWRPESGFLDARWGRYCELMILYLLGIGSPAHALPARSWQAWSRPVMTFQGYTYVSYADPLFVHQYSHAWVDFRGRREQGPG
ncbi:MAG: glucoamylase family protein, partial [Vicinamibacterales bacterium]